MDVKLLVGSRVHQEALSFCRYPTVISLLLWSTNHTDRAVYCCDLLSAILLRFGFDIPPFQDLSLIRNTSLCFPLIITSFTVSMDLISGPFWSRYGPEYSLSKPILLLLASLHCVYQLLDTAAVSPAPNQSSDSQSRCRRTIARGKTGWGQAGQPRLHPKRKKAKNAKRIFWRKTAKLLPGE